MINVGIIGLGFMGATHIKAYRQLEGVRLAAICDADSRRLTGDFSNIVGNIGSNDPLKLDLREVKATKNFDDLLADPDLHLIDICAPTAAHHALAMAALRAGKHVLCEKPMARLASQAREMAEAARQAKGFFMPAMCLRFWPEWAWIRQAIVAQTYGKVLSARFRRVAEPPGWSQATFFNGAESGGALLDLHIHDTDFIQFCFGRPKAVTSSGYTRFSGAIDHVVTHYHFEDSPSGHLSPEGIVHAEGTWAMSPGFGFNMTCTVNFEQATADYDLSRGPDALRLFAPNQPPQTIHCEGPDGYARELDHMLEAIRTGRPPSVVTAQDGLSAVEICEAEEKSVALRQTVAL